MALYCYLPWLSTDHWRTRSSQLLRWSNRSPSPSSTRISVKRFVSPISLLDSLFSLEPLELASDPTSYNEIESSIDIDDNKESSYSSPSYWFTRSWLSIFSLAIANLWEKKIKISLKFRIKSQSEIKQRERKRKQKWEFFGWSELKWGSNGGERKRNFRSKKSIFFFPGKFFLFSKKVEWSQESMRSSL